ncbi:hypothetical protein DL96DRAFT_1534618 [Flagelloscypha sp. PMI_526]|nr:hypothetical protein DL96DRAFT_1534618 [Flagelloscypha sp. PMI_526]
MSAITNVTIVGGSGNLGPSLIDALLAAKLFKVSVYVREESKVIFPSGVKVIKGNYTQSSLEEAFKGQDAVVSTVGVGGFAIQKTIVDAAVANGVKRFFPSDFGVHRTEKTFAFLPITKVKEDLADYLVSREGEISWTAILTSVFFDWALKLGILGFDLANHKVQLMDGGVTKFHATNLSTITGAVIAILSNPELYEKTKNQNVSIPNHETTQREILAVFESITGEKWEVTDNDSDTLIKNAKGTPAELLTMLQVMLYGKVNLGRLPGKHWNNELGLPQQSLEEDLKLILDGKSP